MFGVICTIACLASSTRAQLKYNQSRRDSWDNVRNYLTRGDFSDIDLVSQMRVLDLVSNSDEFQPLKISIGTFYANPDLSGRISKFFEHKLITSYQIDLRSDLSSTPIANLVDVTWIILVENRRILDFYRKSSKSLWSSKNKYIFLLFQRKYPENLEKVFSALWKQNGVSKVLIGSEDDGFKYFYKYLPFEMNSHNFGKIQRVLIDQQNTETFLEDRKKGAKVAAQCLEETCSLIELSTIFEDFINFNNYPIDVTLFKSQMVSISKIGNETLFSGLDVNAMHMLKEVLKADFRVNVPAREYELDPFEVGLQRIDSRKTDLIMTTYFVKPYEKYESYEFTVGVHLDKVCLFGRAAGKVPKSFMPFLPISLDFWPLFIIYNVFISFFWIKFKNLTDSVHQNSANEETPISSDRNPNSNKNLLTFSEYLQIVRKKQQVSNQKSLISNKKLQVSPTENAQISLVNREDYPPEIDPRLVTCSEVAIMSCSHLSGAKTVPQRLFVAGTLFFTIIVVGLYESTLLSAMRKPFEYPELHTLEDVLDSKLPIWTKYQNLKDSTFYNLELKKRVVVVQNKFTLRHIIVENKSALGIMRLSTSDLEDRSEFYDENGEYLLHVVEECPAEYSLSYVVNRFSPYLKRIDQILLRMSEAGFFLKWYNDMRYPIYKGEQRKLASRSLISVLTLEHYSLTFFILLGTFLCSTLVFIAEMQFARSARFRKYNKKGIKRERERVRNKTRSFLEIAVF